MFGYEVLGYYKLKSKAVQYTVMDNAQYIITI